jgi:hypothetical protein
MYSHFSVKIKFKHKGGWVRIYRKKFKMLMLNFGLSHLTYITNTVARITRKKRHFSFHKLVLFGASLSNLRALAYSIFKTFPLNIFTHRGIKIVRSAKYKKQGKVSKYSALIRK